MNLASSSASAPASATVAPPAALAETLDGAPAVVGWSRTLDGLRDTGHGTLAVFGADEDGFPTMFGKEQITRDSSMMAAIGHVEGFYGWLEGYGRNGWDGAGSHLTLNFGDSRSDTASSLVKRGRANLSFGEPTGDLFAVSPGNSPEIVAHELTHTIIHPLWLARGVREGVSDVLGHSYASHVEHPAARDWKLADEVLVPARAANGLRDAAAPAIPTMSAAAAAMASSDWVDEHDLGGPITAVGARLERALGPRRNNDLWARAVLDHLPARAREVDPDLKVPLGGDTFEQLRDDTHAVARATMDAATERGWLRDLPAIREAWRAAEVVV